MKTVICLVCNSPSPRLHTNNFYKLEEDVFSLVKCKHCGFIFVNPSPSKNKIKKMYENTYFDECYDSGLSRKSYFENKEELLTRYKDILEHIKKFKKSGKLLDIGCAGGLFLNLAQRSFDVEGIEISPEMSAEARNLGFKVFTGSIEHSSLSPESFDVIYMGHVLEHMSNPKKAIRKVHSLLKENGLLVIEVPSFINSFYYSFLKFFYKFLPLKPLPVFKILPEGKYLKPYHLLEFSPKTLKILLKQENFKIIKLNQTIPVPDILIKRTNYLKRSFFRVIFGLLKTLTKLGFRGGSITVYSIKR